MIVNVAGAVNVPAIDNMTLNYPTPLHRGDGLSLAQQQANKLKVLNALKEAYQDACHGIRLGMSGKWVGHPGQLLMVLAASASYIAVPAVIRHAIPEANPSLYFGLSLGVTFPLNILLGIPVCIAVAKWATG